MRIQKFGAALVAVAALALGACSLFSPTEINQGQQVIIGQPPASPTPSPSASPSPSPSPSTPVASGAIFAFGYENAVGQTCTPPPDGQRFNGSQQYIVPAGCKLILTATPFDAAGNPVHLPSTTPITWTVSGPGTLTERPETPWNREYNRTGAGVATVTATFAGKVAVRGFANQ